MKQQPAQVWSQPSQPQQTPAPTPTAQQLQLQQQQRKAAQHSATYQRLGLGKGASVNQGRRQANSASFKESYPHPALALEVAWGGGSPSRHDAADGVEDEPPPPSGMLSPLPFESSLAPDFLALFAQIEDIDAPFQPPQRGA